MDKQEIERRLHLILADIPEGEWLPTRTVVERVCFPDPVDLGVANHVFKLGREMAERGPPEITLRGPMKGKAVRRLRWRRLNKQAPQPEAADDWKASIEARLSAIEARLDRLTFQE